MTIDADTLWLRGESAADLMTPSPVSLRDDATLAEALATLVDKGFSAAPVVDPAGRPLGVLSRSDVLRLERRQVDYRHPHPTDEAASAGSAEEAASALPVEGGEFVRVRDIMTPTIHSIRPESSARQVVDQMVANRWHRVFVVDGEGALVGVISAVDILQRLAP